MRRGGYLENSPASLNPRRRCLRQPERYRRRIALLPPNLPRPDCQPVVPQSQLCEAVEPVVRRADQPLIAVIRRHGQRSRKLTLFTTFGVSQRASTCIPCQSAVTSAVRCRNRRRIIYRAALVAVKVSAPLSTTPSGTCFGNLAVMALRRSSFSRILTQRNKRWRATSAASAPYAVSASNAVRRLTLPHAAGDGLNLHADRIPLPVNRAYQRGAGRWQRLMVERQRPGVWLLTAVKHARAGADTGIAQHERFHDIARYMAKPFGTHAAEVHGLRFQQFLPTSHSPRCACPRLVQPKVSIFVTLRP